MPVSKCCKKSPEASFTRGGPPPGGCLGSSCSKQASPVNPKKKRSPNRKLHFGELPPQFGKSLGGKGEFPPGQTSRFPQFSHLNAHIPDKNHPPPPEKPGCCSSPCRSKRSSCCSSPTTPKSSARQSQSGTRRSCCSSETETPRSSRGQSPKHFHPYRPLWTKFLSRDELQEAELPNASAWRTSPGGPPQARCRPCRPLKSILKLCANDSKAVQTTPRGSICKSTLPSKSESWCPFPCARTQSQDSQTSPQFWVYDPTTSRIIPMGSPAELSPRTSPCEFRLPPKPVNLSTDETKPSRHPSPYAAALERVNARMTPKASPPRRCKSPCKIRVSCSTQVQTEKDSQQNSPIPACQNLQQFPNPKMSPNQNLQQFPNPQMSGNQKPQQFPNPQVSPNQNPQQFRNPQMSPDQNPQQFPNPQISAHQNLQQNPNPQMSTQQNPQQFPNPQISAHQNLQQNPNPQMSTQPYPQQFPNPQISAHQNLQQNPNPQMSTQQNPQQFANPQMLNQQNLQQFSHPVVTLNQNLEQFSTPQMLAQQNLQHFPNPKVSASQNLQQFPNPNPQLSANHNLQQLQNPITSAHQNIKQFLYQQIPRHQNLQLSPNSQISAQNNISQLSPPKSRTVPKSGTPKSATLLVPNPQGSPTGLSSNVQSCSRAASPSPSSCFPLARCTSPSKTSTQNTSLAQTQKKSHPSPHISVGPMICSTIGTISPPDTPRPSPRQGNLPPRTAKGCSVRIQKDSSRSPRISMVSGRHYREIPVVGGSGRLYREIPVVSPSESPPPSPRRCQSPKKIGTSCFPFARSPKHQHSSPPIKVPYPQKPQSTRPSTERSKVTSYSSSQSMRTKRSKELSRSRSCFRSAQTPTSASPSPPSQSMRTSQSQELSKSCFRSPQTPTSAAPSPTSLTVRTNQSQDISRSLSCFRTAETPTRASASPPPPLISISNGAKSWQYKIHSPSMSPRVSPRMSPRISSSLTQFPTISVSPRGSTQASPRSSPRSSPCCSPVDRTVTVTRQSGMATVLPEIIEVPIRTFSSWFSNARPMITASRPNHEVQPAKSGRVRRFWESLWNRSTCQVPSCKGGLLDLASPRALANLPYVKDERWIQCPDVRAFAMFGFNVGIVLFLTFLVDLLHEKLEPKAPELPTNTVITALNYGTTTCDVQCDQSLPRSCHICPQQCPADPKPSLCNLYIYE